MFMCSHCSMCREPGGHARDGIGRRYMESMRTRLERTYRFEAAHSLPKVPPGHKCARMHGHSYKVEVSVTGPVGEKSGWLMDHAEISKVVKPLVAVPAPAL